jgi:hypothetical protein
MTPCNKNRKLENALKEKDARMELVKIKTLVNVKILKKKTYHIV